MNPRSEAEEGLVQLTNGILSQIHVSTRVRNVRDITPGVFVLLFEGLCGDVLPDVKRHVRTREDAVHNCQVVIDTLSMDVLNTSLSHITGDSIVAGDLTAIANLLDVFSGLMDYMLDKIGGSDASSIVSRARSEDFDDPDLVTPDIINSILQKELSKGRSRSHHSANNSTGNSTEELIRLGQVTGGGSDWTLSDRSSLLRGLSNSNVGSRSSETSHCRGPSPLQNSVTNRRPSPHNVKLAKKSPLRNVRTSNSTLSSRKSDAVSDSSFGSNGVGSSGGGQSPSLAESGKRPHASFSANHSAYDDLESRMRDTVAFSRAAVAGSPLRSSRHIEESTEVLRSSLEKVTLSDSQKDTDNAPKSILSPVCARKTSRKAVTFKPKHFSASSTESSRDGSPSCKRPTSRPAAAKQNNETQNLAPHTFQDYLRKYYGKQHPRVVRDDSGGRGAEDSSDEAEFEKQKKLKEISRPKVRFEDVLDDSAPGRTGSVRRKLKAEDRENRLKTQFLSQTYNEELRDYEEELWEDVAKQRLKAKETNTEFRKKFHNAKSKKYKAGKKYSTPVSQKSRPRKTSSTSVLLKGRKRNSSPPKRKLKATSGEDLLPWLLDEFPFLHLSAQTMHDVWTKSSRCQVDRKAAETAATKSTKRSKQSSQLEEAERRQKVLLDIMKKELTHNKRMKEVQERRKQQQSVKASIREKRLASVRSRKYYDEFQVRMRSKMLKKRSREEMLFKKLFEEGLDIQKDRIREIRKYAGEQRAKRREAEKNDLASLENYYKDQFGLLAESMAKERSDIHVRESAQAKMLSSLKQELRRKMEREIRDFQDQLWREDDDSAVHFRELDAQRIRHLLHSSYPSTATAAPLL